MVLGRWRIVNGPGDSPTERARVTADRVTLVGENHNGRETAPRRAAPCDAGRRRPATRVGPPPPGARPHAGGLRGARGLPPPARLPAGPGSPGPGRLRPWRAARLRPAQYPLHLEHGHRRVGPG